MVCLVLERAQKELNRAKGTWTIRLSMQLETGEKKVGFQSPLSSWLVQAMEDPSRSLESFPGDLLDATAVTIPIQNAMDGEDSEPELLLPELDLDPSYDDHSPLPTRDSTEPINSNAINGRDDHTAPRLRRHSSTIPRSLLFTKLLGL